MASVKTTILVQQGTAVLERTSASIARSTAIAVETEQVGTEVLGELGTQRDTLTRTRDRLIDTEGELTRMRENKSNQENVVNTGIALRIVQRWTKIYCEGGRDTSPPPYNPEGHKRSVTQRTLNVIQRQLEANPRIHIKELRPGTLFTGWVIERSVRRYVKDDM
ncbi:Vesicle transport through interaction with t-SNAREs 1B [Portunus trituberculatus]|uniref:Vesicle transport through interaction with t-SNAREs 1B n=1 Tax=Portunus trituberculatus TaxID=210409 RepID=A0A5B7GU78_PORTR|nr:Vesicle transport through interaction with t-SNAREs 1B [Portunus trituberculatus]